MRMILNCAYGSYSVPGEVCELIGCDPYDDSDSVRMDGRFIIYVLSHKDLTLKVVEFPDECTDFTIIDYGGLENLLYVLNGKINWANYYY